MIPSLSLFLSHLRKTYSAITFFMVLIGKRSSKNMSQLLTVSEVADILRVDATTVRRWVKYGVLEAISLPHARKRRSYRIKRETLEKVFENNTHLQPAQA
jgi:excisionase family DNA binding protein